MGLGYFTNLLYTLGLRTWKKIVRRPVTLMFSLVQPLFWMLLFGFLMQRYPLDLPSGLTYRSFILPGICAMTVLFGASQAGISHIRDLQTGFLQRILNSPCPMWAIHMSKIVADGSRLLVQAFFVLILGILLGATISPTWFPLFIGVLSLFSFAIALGSLSCIVALRTKRQETMASFVHLINMPIFFTSTALVPHKNMPSWLETISRWNPLTLAVEDLRNALLFQESASVTGHLLPLVVLAIVFATLAVRELKQGLMVQPWELK